MRVSLASLLVVLALLLAPPAHAQLADPAAAAGPRAWAPMTTQPAAAVQPERRRPDEVLALGGVVGGGAGLVVGALAGAWLQDSRDPDCIDFCIG